MSSIMKFTEEALSIAVDLKPDPISENLHFERSDVSCRARRPPRFASRKHHVLLGVIPDLKVG